MKHNNTDSTANLSRFARDKRQRVSSAERVERSPRPRREADSEGHSEYRARTTSATKRSSYNPHFTEDNRLRPEYEQHPRVRRSDERTERSEYRRAERSEGGNAQGPAYRGKAGDMRRKSSGDYRSQEGRSSAPHAEKRGAGFKSSGGFKGKSNFKSNGSAKPKGRDACSKLDINSIGFPARILDATVYVECLRCLVCVCHYCLMLSSGTSQRLQLGVWKRVLLRRK